MFKKTKVNSKKTLTNMLPHSLDWSVRKVDNGYVSLVTVHSYFPHDPCSYSVAGVGRKRVFEKFFEERNEAYQFVIDKLAEEILEPTQ